MKKKIIPEMVQKTKETGKGKETGGTEKGN